MTKYKSEWEQSDGGRRPAAFDEWPEIKWHMDADKSTDDYAVLEVISGDDDDISEVSDLKYPIIGQI